MLSCIEVDEGGGCPPSGLVEKEEFCAGQAATRLMF